MYFGTLLLSTLLWPTYLNAAGAPVVTVEKPTPYPSYLTTATTIDIVGTVKNAKPSLHVVVSDQRGSEYKAQISPTQSPNTFTWQVYSVFLKSGTTIFKVKAVDKDEIYAVRYLTVTQPEQESEKAKSFGTAKFGNRTVQYEIVKGRAIIEGDIDIGSAMNVRDAITPNNKKAATGIAYISGRAGITTSYPNFLWPKSANVAQIPYTVTSGNTNVNSAISQFNATFSGIAQWVPRTAEVDYVDFNLDVNDHSGAGFSSVGRVGGKQQIGGSIDVTVPTILHEMGHAIGLYHEQSRVDRDVYITLLNQNIIKSLKANFNPVLDNVQKNGLYDYASIMHYQAFTFSKNGEPTIETIPAGIPLSELGDYSAGDIDAVKRLYQVAPSDVTITTNPPGLQVIVDGNTITTPQTISFALNSVHTLDIPAGSQTLAGTTYTYGRWSDNVNRSHSITIAPGNGLTGSPNTKPAVTVYQANFVELVPYAPFVYPAASGSVTPNPAPQSYPPATGLFYQKRQPVSLQANANAGYSLYRLYTAYGPVSQNPKITRNPDWILAYFTPQAKTTINTSPSGRWIWVDGAWWEGPVSWSPYYPADGNWTAGTTHHLDVAITPQLPYSWSIRYPWLSWSDSGAQAHDIVVPSNNATYTANFSQEVNASYWAQQVCAGQVTMTPSSPDGFYTAGTNVSFRQTATPGWVFTGWLEDTTGTTNPKTLPMNDERLVVANYNTINKPLTITSLTPATKIAGQAGFTLVIKGTGFTANSRIFINGAFRPATFVSATQLKVAITATDIQTAGAFQVYVDNIPAGIWPCAAYAIHDFYVLSGSAQPLLKPTPLKLTFAAQQVGTTSLPKTVTLKNSGSAVLGLHDIVLNGKNPSDFSYTTTCTSSLPKAGGQCTVSVTFQPTAANTRTAQLEVLDTAFDSPQIIPLSGTGSP